MQRVIVTVKREGEARVRDLEVPAEVESRRLAQFIAEALGWHSDPAGQPLEYRIEAHPLGRLLRPEESLADAGVWDGSWLVLQGAGHIKLESNSESGPRHEAPVVTGWRKLSVDLPGASSPAGPSREEPAGQPQRRESGFVWKQLD